MYRNNNTSFFNLLLVVPVFSLARYRYAWAARGTLTVNVSLLKKNLTVTAAGSLLTSLGNNDK